MNKERVRRKILSQESSQKRYAQNAEQFKIKHHERYKANPLKKKARVNANYKANPQKHKDRKRAEYSANPQKHKDRKSTEYSANPQKQKARVSANYEANPQKYKDRKSAEYSVNPQKHRHRKSAEYHADPQKSRARKRDLYSKQSRRQYYRKQGAKWKTLAAELYEKHKQRRLAQMRLYYVRSTARNREIRRKEQNAEFERRSLKPPLLYVSKGSAEHQRQRERFWRQRAISRMVKRHAKSFPSSARTPTARRLLTEQIGLVLDTAIELQKDKRKELRKCAKSLWDNGFNKFEKAIGSGDIDSAVEKKLAELYGCDNFHVFTQENYDTEVSAHGEFT
ncbi:MAG: hypothetical protein GY737_28965, partial [Desulfobacteraceae bacterium]|nr:hypothetical protein [Desulfobacteraceae bacterium]